MTRQPLIPTDKANQLVGSVLSGSSHCEAAHIHGIKPWTADMIVKNTVRLVLLRNALAEDENLLSHGCKGMWLTLQRRTITWNSKILANSLTWKSLPAQCEEFWRRLGLPEGRQGRSYIWLRSRRRRELSGLRSLRIGAQKIGLRLSGQMKSMLCLVIRRAQCLWREICRKNSIKTM